MRLRTLFFIASFLFVAGGIALRCHPYFQKPITDISISVLSLEPDQIYTISIKKGEEELLLTKGNNRWLATNGQWSNPVEPQKIQLLLASVQQVSSEGIATQNQADWPALGQQEGEVKWVRLYSKTDLDQAFYISRPEPKDSSDVVYSYIRLPESTVVYKIKEGIGALWSLPFELYRDQQLLSFDPKSVRSFSVERNREPAFRYIRMDSVWQDSLGQTLPNSLIQQWLRRLSNFRGQHYADRFSEVEGNQNLIHAIHLNLENQGTLNLEVYADSNRLDLPFVIRSNQFSGRYFRSDSIQLNELMIR